MGKAKALILGLHSWEQQNISYRRGVGKKHYETVNTEAETACRRKSVFKRCDVVVINLCGSVGILRSLSRNLALESLALIDWIVKLGECVAVLGAVDEVLESLGEERIVRLSLSEGRILYGVVVDEGRLNELILNEGVEELDENCAACCILGNLNVVTTTISPRLLSIR